MTRTAALAPFLALSSLALLPLAAAAQTVPTEVSQLGGQQITLHLHPFLTDEETAVLRMVASNEQALSLFITQSRRHSAMALAPAEGFIRNGQPVASASAISDLRNAADARTGALEVCERARQTGPGCVIALEVAPGR